MIIETIELYNNQEITIDELQTRINSGEFNDILSKYSILIMTKSGIVKIDKDNKNIILNPTVDLSNYVLKTEVPKIIFDNDGNLKVTINGVTKTFAAITETE